MGIANIDSIPESAEGAEFSYGRRDPGGNRAAARIESTEAQVVR